MYWTDAGDQPDPTGHLNGSSQETILAGCGPYGIALDLASGKMY
jgi:hypothetical protein